jgi:hypothetical protein
MPQPIHQIYKIIWQEYTKTHPEIKVCQIVLNLAFWCEITIIKKLDKNIRKNETWIISNLRVEIEKLF